MKNNKKGISMLEIILYSAFLAIILGLITNFFYEVINFKVNTQINSDLFQNSEIIFNSLNQDLVNQAVVIPNSSLFSSSLLISSSSGEINYSLENGVLKRNGIDLTDNKVKFIFPENNGGFRKIDNTVQVIFTLEAKQKPFGQNEKRVNYQSTYYVINDE